MTLETSLLALVGVITAAALTAFAAILATQAKRISDLEHKTDAAADYNRKLWAYCRRLIDLYYKHRRDGAPDPPELPTEESN